ncbi:hypothetical protein [Pseudoalteromonas nigrifaciens]|uniref:hypothetical protein n=1 Tax=Pseudoalteromonas nigrifaciens TaxID=28109 RepID=UPI003FD3C221
MKALLKKKQIISAALLIGFFVTSIISISAVHHFLSEESGIKAVGAAVLPVREQVQSIFKNRFPELKIENISTGPERTWVVVGKYKNEVKRFYVLPDLSHVIEGTITSLYDVPAEKEASRNTVSMDKESKLQREFITKVQSLQSEKKQVVDSQPNNNTHPFKLPELNSVLTSDDKNKFYNRTNELEYIEVGSKSAPLVHVFFDFNCSGCRHAKKVLKKFTDKGDLRVRYIPVGVITKESSIKAAYTLIPSKNEDRKVLLDYFVKPGTADELIKSKAPKAEVLRALNYVNNANKVFMFTPKKLTPTFAFKLNGEVVIANLTSERGLQNLVDRLQQ